MQANSTKNYKSRTEKFLSSLYKSRISIESINNNILSQSMISKILLNLRSSYHHYILFKLAIVTGLKAQELVNIKSKHIISDNQSIYVPPLTIINDGESRYVGLEIKFFKEMLRFIHCLQPEEYIFAGRNGSMSWRSLSYTLTKVRQVTHHNFGMKDFQNSFCISLLRNGANIEELAYFLGYKSNSGVRRRFRRMFQSEKSRYDLVDSIFLKSA